MRSNIFAYNYITHVTEVLEYARQNMIRAMNKTSEYGSRSFDRNYAVLEYANRYVPNAQECYTAANIYYNLSTDMQNALVAFKEEKPFLLFSTENETVTLFQSAEDDVYVVQYEYSDGYFYNENTETFADYADALRCFYSRIDVASVSYPEIKLAEYWYPVSSTFHNGVRVEIYMDRGLVIQVIDGNAQYI